jgi:phasin family protein
MNNNNAFANNPFADMFKNNDMFKNGADMLKNSASMFKSNFDMNQPLNAIRRNAEAVTEACQVVAEGAQESFRAGTESLRSNVETVLKNSKNVFNSGSPEAGLAKQAELARQVYETTLANIREMAEMATKCGMEAFEVLNKRASETMSEISETAQTVKKKK